MWTSLSQVSTCNILEFALFVKLFSHAVPTPVSVILTSTPGSPIHGGATLVTLTCTVELTQAVDILLTVNTQLTGPAGVTLFPTTPVMESLTRYTSTAMVNSFGRDQSGNYTCTATVSSGSSFLTGSNEKTGRAAFTIGKFFYCSAWW